MPDDRLIHRTLGHSEKINRLTDFEKLVWLIYKLAADDFGVMRFSALSLQEAARFLEQRPARTVLRGLEAVHKVELIRTFDHQGRAYCYQTDWQTWQKITHPRQTKQPAPPLTMCDLNTRWLFSHHPKGGKISWQAPDGFQDKNRESTGSQSGSPPGVSPDALQVQVGPVFVGSGCSSGNSGVRGRGDAPGARPRMESIARQEGIGKHIDHLACFPVCMSPPIARKYLPRFGGDEDALQAWAKDICSEWQARTERGERVPEGDDFAFWSARYDEHFKQAGDNGDQRGIVEHIRRSLEEKPVRNAR